MRITQMGAVTSLYVEHIGARWEQWILLRSDAHHDSMKNARELELQHLELAKRRRAWVFDFGDLFDAMQGRIDPRRSMDELRPEYRRDDYYDFVIADAAEFYAPYAKNFKLLARGNHETAVRKNANTDLTDRLVYTLRSQHKSEVVAGGYGGWIRLMFGSSGTPLGSLKIKYFHGAGGDAPVTRGVIHTSRQAVYLPDADVVINGHNHNMYYVPISRERISNKGHHYFDLQHHVRVPGYKQDYADGTGGWDVQRGGVPKPVGAVWMRLTLGGNQDKARDIEISFEAAIEGAQPVSAVQSDERAEPFYYSEDGGDQ